MNGSVREACPAKVNLFLEVLGRREDGYHELETVLLALDFADTLEVHPRPEGLTLEVVGADLPAGPGNLAYDAARRFLDEFAPDRGAAMILTKRIPVGAGLGGGSSDAAGALFALRSAFRPDLAPEDLHPLAASLGSDVPFFLGGPCAVATGRGDRIRPVTAPLPTWLVLFTPPFPLATPEVYRHVRVPAESERQSVQPFLEMLPARPLGGGLFNRLEEAATAAEPRVAGVRKVLESHGRPEEQVVLSGSGSTFFVTTSGTARAAALASELNRTEEGRALAVRTRGPVH